MLYFKLKIHQHINLFRIMRGLYAFYLSADYLNANYLKTIICNHAKIGNPQNEIQHPWQYKSLQYANVFASNGLTMPSAAKFP